jgi:hypothetical protein
MIRRRTSSGHKQISQPAFSGRPAEGRRLAQDRSGENAAACHLKRVVRPALRLFDS